MTSAGSRAKHLGNNSGGNGGKAICDGTDSELPDSLLYSVLPFDRTVHLRDADIGVLVEHLLDGDEVLVNLVVTVMISKVRPVERVVVLGWCVPNLVVEKVDAILSHIFETVENLPSVLGGIGSRSCQIHLHRSKSVSHCNQVEGEVCRGRCEGGVD